MVRTKVFKSYSEPKLQYEATRIAENMEGNSYFPTPTPTLLVLQAAITAFVLALTAAGKGDHSAIADKNVKKATLVDLLEQLANYVNFTANGNLTALLTTGMEVVKQPSHRQLEVPQNISVKYGNNPGDMQIIVGTAIGARSFMFQYTTHPVTGESVWTSAAGTNKKHMFTSLTPGVKYWFRVVAFGSKSQQSTSVAVEAIAV